MKKHSFSLLISVIIVLISSFFINPIYEFKVYIWSYVSSVFVLSIAIRIIMFRKREDILFFPAIFITWLNFLEPYLKAEKANYYTRVVPENYLFDMSLFSALGIITLFLGYYLFFQKKRINPIFEISTKFNSVQLGKIMLTIMFFYLFYETLLIITPDLMQPFKTVFAIIEYTPSLISAGLTLILIRKNGNLLTIIILFVFLIIQLLIAIATTLFFTVIIIAIVPFIVYFFETKKIPLLSFFLVAIILLPIYSLRHYYREDALKWWYYGESVSTEFLMERGIKIINDTYADGNIFDYSDKIKDNSDNGESRLESVTYLGQCVYYHEILKHPYLHGKTFWWLPIAPIPRFIIPFKPENNMSSAMAEEYGIKGKNSIASMNWPMMAEYYINFGFWGIMIFSLFQGAAYRYIYKLIAYGKGDINLIVLFSLILPIIKIESNVTLVFGQVLQYLLIWFILSRTVLKKYRYKKRKY